MSLLSEIRVSVHQRKHQMTVVVTFINSSNFLPSAVSCVSVRRFVVD